MILDRFTPEEIKQIQEELKYLGIGSAKEYETQIKTKIDTMFDRDSYLKRKLFPYQAVGDAVFLIMDYVFDNFEISIYRWKSQHCKEYRRKCYIPYELKENYWNFANDFIDLLKKYKPDKACSLPEIEV